MEHYDVSIFYASTDSIEVLLLSAVPAFLNVEADGEKEKVTVQAQPLPEDIPFAFEKRLVIEYYWKLK